MVVSGCREAQMMHHRSKAHPNPEQQLAARGRNKAKRPCCMARSVRKWEKPFTIACKDKSAKCTQVHFNADSQEWKTVTLKTPCEHREEQVPQNHWIFWVGMYPQGSLGLKWMTCSGIKPIISTPLLPTEVISVMRDSPDPSWHPSACGVPKCGMTVPQPSLLGKSQWFPSSMGSSLYVDKPSGSQPCNHGQVQHICSESAGN